MDPRANSDEISIDLVARRRRVELGTTIGMPVIKAYGKAVAGHPARDRATAFRLPDEGIRAEALALEGAELVDPTRRRKPMTEWVLVPTRHVSH